MSKKKDARIVEKNRVMDQISRRSGGDQPILLETESSRYIENPKTKGSGIICCIPQTGVCPIGCPD